MTYALTLTLRLQVMLTLPRAAFGRIDVVAKAQGKSRRWWNGANKAVRFELASDWAADGIEQQTGFGS